MKLQNLKNRVLGSSVVVGALALASGAHAAVDVSALTEATTDITTLGGAAVAFACVAFGVMALYHRIPRG